MHIRMVMLNLCTISCVFCAKHVDFLIMLTLLPCMDSRQGMFGCNFRGWKEKKLEGGLQALEDLQEL